MAKSKPKPTNPVAGRWRIVSMSAWEDDYLDEEVAAYIEFDTQGRGKFQIGYIPGQIDYRIETRDGSPAAARVSCQG